MSTLPTEDLERLANKILDGNVAFFIGAGFSLDQEKNSASKLIARLLARFLAITTYLKESHKNEDITEGCDALLRELINTFDVRGAPSGDIEEEIKACIKDPSLLASGDNISILANEYYNTNDWICTAYSELLGFLLSIENIDKVAISRYEKDYLKEIDPSFNPPKKIEIEHLKDVEAPHNGKALFLDTMGFDDTEVMGGKPTEAIDIAECSYKKRLGIRHHVLARFAREGLSPALITTNYDLLIEGAYRLSGFQVDSCHKKAPSPSRADPEKLHRIVGANQFFEKGDGHQAALLVKIHGCVEQYRKRRKVSTSLCQVLPQMVFTFREIQNWRNDFWSRDYLRTLLRTRTIAMIGYSGKDPVLHDTFRTVYEEMADCREQLDDDGNAPALNAAPIFYFGPHNKTEFHGSELLRAASLATGIKSHNKLTPHPNYLRFHFKGGETPDIDQMLLWLYHRVFRLRQEQQLKRTLNQVELMLFQKPRPAAEHRAILRNLQALLQKETEVNQFQEKITAWSYYFQAGLLREFALGETLVSTNTFKLNKLESTRKQAWYYPAGGNPCWTSWGTIIELALRRMIRFWANESAPNKYIPDCSPLEQTNWVYAASQTHPTLYFSKGDKQPTPFSLTIQLSVSTRTTKPSTSRTSSRTASTLWKLSPGGLPWIPSKKGNTVPSTQTIWRWAAGIENSEDREAIHKHLGIEEHQND
jgi:hypothetical protein